MKKIAIVILGLVLSGQVLWACPACEEQQPSITRGITHGTGPQNEWDWIIVGAIVCLTLITLILSLKYLVRPGEKDSNHIKLAILNK